MSDTNGVSQPNGRTPEIVAGLPLHRFFALVSVGIVVAVCSIYLPVLGFDFLEYDDKSYVFGNPDIENGLTWDAVKAVFTRSYVSSWHPVAMLSHAFDVTLFGPEPGLHHLMNVLFHAANSLLVLLVFHRLTGRPIESAVLAVLWAVHPQHVEPVAWIASRKDLVSTLFFLLGLLAYAGYARRGGAGRYALVLAALVVGLLAKPMLVTVPFLLLLLDYWPLNRFTDRPTVWRCALEKVPLLGVCLGVAVVTQFVQTEGGAVRSLEDVPVEYRLLNAPAAYGHYLVKTAWPAGLSAFYPHPMDDVGWARVAGGGLAVAAFSVLAVAQWRRRPYVFVGWFWFAGMLAPVIGLVQFGSHGMADRYTYVPHLGLFMAIIWTISEAVRRRPPLRTAAVAFMAGVAVAAAIASSRYLMVFRNDVTLFSHVISVTRPHVISWINLGYGYHAYGWYDEALDCYAIAQRAPEAPVQLLRNIGASHALRGAPYDAREAFADLLERYPDDEVARKNFESMEAGIAELEAELRPLEREVERNPDDAALRERLAFEYVATGQPERALGLFGGVDAMPPALAAAVLAEQRRLEEAVAAYESAIPAQPDNPHLLFDYARVLHRAGRDAEARMTLDRLIELHPDYTDAYRYEHTLGW